MQRIEGEQRGLEETILREKHEITENELRGRELRERNEWDQRGKRKSAD